MCGSIADFIVGLLALGIAGPNSGLESTGSWPASSPDDPVPVPPRQ
ncbi:MAG: hypothetical protein LC799_14095 [Actinobacteria bacterium]|nr:hypothetical protein [Actinomycetota bacterium]